jgi:hypothetical protein
MDSTAFSLLANSSPEVDGSQEVELTIGSLSILIGPSGSSRLSDSTKQNPSASEPEATAIVETSESSSSEVNSPVSIEKASITEADETQEIFDLEEKARQAQATETMEYSNGSSSEVNPPVSLEEVQKGKAAESNKAKDNLNTEIQLDDLTICLDDISDKSTDTWKTGLELSEDGDSIFSSFNSNIRRQCQVLAIVGDNSEEFDENNNPVINPANINRGANHLAEGQTTECLASREKIRLSVDEWKIIRDAVEHGMPITSNSSRDMLFGYHYALRQQGKQLAKEKSEIQKRKNSAIVASEAARRARSDASYSNARKNRRHGSRYDNLEYSDR